MMKVSAVKEPEKFLF